ncbi:MAG: DNA gyrase subunit A [Clostridia bacterium]|nr:DNA gyrase subunit A [Oscillospiraceae bacterium]MBR4893267.1 DNA gyrase subunit A [Clostridia bacterium]
MANEKNEKIDSHFEEYFDTQTIVNVDIEKRMKEAFIDYAMSVIVSRALPDVRDGLKPVHRRILYSMHEEHLTYDKPFFKSATTVGNVIGRYHPHGDASVYDAMVRLAQDFSMRYMLIDGHGNFGSVDGDPPAAYRYTEARMSKLSNLMLENIEKNTVDFAPNFDEKRVEPTVLPTRIPTLLINGSSGIAVGMATNIPPHNLSEVLDGVIAQIDNPDITTEELMEYIKGPDFPTYASIMGRSGIRSAYETGRGKIIVRAKTEIVEKKNGGYSIVITELPYLVNKRMLVESIANLVKDKKIDGLSDIEDHSSKRAGIRIEIYLKKEANPQVVLNQLYKYSRLQDSFSVNMIALQNGRPKLMCLKEVISHFIKFQEEIVTRRIKFDREKALARMHILEGLRIALSNIDEIINIIRNSYDDAKERLIERFEFSEIQAQSVLDMRLAQLQRLNGEKIEEEYNELRARVNEFESLLGDRGLLFEQIKKELNEIKEKYGDERRTEITFDYSQIEDEDLIEEEDVVITMTHTGYIKRLKTDTYRSQKRGGRGISGMATKEEDFVEQIFTTSTHNFILCFTNKGRMFKMKGYQIPEASRTAKGMPIVNLLSLDPEEKVTATIPIKEFDDDSYLTMVTKLGTIKKTKLSEYNSNRSGGLNAIGLNEGDELIKVEITNGENDIVLGTSLGNAIRFNEKDVRPMGRTAHGVRGIKLRDNDFVVGACLVTDESRLLVVSENGMGKRTELSEYKVQTRGGKGIRTYKISSKTGNVTGIKTVTDNDDIMLITSEGVIIRTAVEDISTLGRDTSGVKIMKLKDDVKVVSVAVVEKEEEETEETNEI